MKIENWVKFEKPGEKDKLKTIIETNDELQAISQIAQDFNMDLMDATSVYNIFKERMTNG